MHSDYNKLIPHHFDDYFIPISSIHFYSTRPTSNNLFLPTYPLLITCFYLELTLLHENVSLHLLVQKCGLLYQCSLSLHAEMLVSPKATNEAA